MDILVYEHILGEKISGNSPSPILNEAKLIAKSVIKDFAKYYPNSKISLLANKQNKNILGNLDLIYRDYNVNLVCDIENHARKYKKVLIIAPEENLCLHSIVKALENKALSLINCDSEFIKTTTYKNEAYNNIKISKKYLVKTYLNYTEIAANKKIIAKINDGLGSEKLYIFNNREELENNKDKITKKHFFQDYKEGRTISINIVASKKKYQIISINEQIYKNSSHHEISLEKIFIGRFNYMYKLFKIFVENIMINFNGYYGFFGIDAILDSNNNIFFLEINPRLTSSYVGLNSSLGFNPVIFLEDISYNFDISKNKIFLENIKNEK